MEAQSIVSCSLFTKKLQDYIQPIMLDPDQDEYQ